jgi:hypothetical protein
MGENKLSNTIHCANATNVMVAVAHPEKTQQAV